MRTKNTYDQFTIKNNGVNTPQQTHYESFEVKPDRYDYADRFEYNETMNTKDFMTGVIFGAVVGAAAALMMAPKSGRELRDNLNIQAGSLKERASELTDTAKDKTANISSVVQEKSSVLMDKVKSMKSSSDGSTGLNNLDDKKEEAKSMVDNVADTVKDKVDNTADTAKSKLDEAKKAFDEAEKSTGSVASKNGSENSSAPKAEGWVDPAAKGINENKQNGGLNTGANKTGFAASSNGQVNTGAGNNSGTNNNFNSNNSNTNNKNSYNNNYKNKNK